MRRFHLKFTLRWLMIVVGLAALASLAAVQVCREFHGTEQRLAVLVASIAAAVYGVGSMRRPLAFFLPLVVAWMALPRVDHPGFNIFNITIGGCFLGWIVGAPFGLNSRRPLTEEDPVPADSRTLRSE